LESQLPPIPEIYVPDYVFTGETTPPSENPISSSVASTPPKGLKRLCYNQKEYPNLEGISLNDQQNVDKLFEHNLVMREQPAISNDIVSNIRAA